MKDEYRYIAYYASDCDHETFKTFEQAEKWLKDAYNDEDEGYSEETMHGADYIAKITHRSKFIETDRKDNYHEHNDDCDNGENCDQEEWPHSDDFEAVGNIIMEAVG